MTSNVLHLHKPRTFSQASARAFGRASKLAGRKHGDARLAQAGQELLKSSPNADSQNPGADSSLPPGPTSSATPSAPPPASKPSSLGLSASPSAISPSDAGPSL